MRVSSRPGLVSALVAVAMAGASAVVVSVTASESETLVTQLAVLAVMLLAFFVFLGARRWVGIASVPMLAAVVLEAGFADSPSWIRSIAVGCMWFVTMELAWEAIARREPIRRSPSVNARRVVDVATVVGLSLAIGLLAAALASLAPVRSVFLQAVVLAALLASFVVLIRDVAANGAGRTKT